MELAQLSQPLGPRLPLLQQLMVFVGAARWPINRTGLACAENAIGPAAAATGPILVVDRI
jgi:hypothetical protein